MLKNPFNRLSYCQVNRLIEELRIELCKETDREVCNEEILQRKEDHPTTLIKMNRLSSKFKQFLETMQKEYTNRTEIVADMKENAIIF